MVCSFVYNYFIYIYVYIVISCSCLCSLRLVALTRAIRTHHIRVYGFEFYFHLAHLRMFGSGFSTHTLTLSVCLGVFRAVPKQTQHTIAKTTAGVVNGRELSTRGHKSLCRAYGVTFVFRRAQQQWGFSIIPFIGRGARVGIVVVVVAGVT